MKSNNIKIIGFEKKLANALFFFEQRIKMQLTKNKRSQ